MEYLAVTVLIGSIWSLLYYARPDLRKMQLWSSWYFTTVMTIGFVALKVTLDLPVEQSINPGYWHPNTLFNLNALTGGYAIEDAFFIFFMGGVGAVVYEELFRKHVARIHAKHRPHFAVKIGVAAAALVALLHVNLIYALIAFGFAGAFVIWWQRHDLIRHSLVGGAAFLSIYAVSYWLVLFMFPEFVAHHYNFSNVSGLTFVQLPIEEYLFAFSFGLMWSPLYEYMRDVR
ncbi:MAG: hypothetical protein G01um10148_765 [Parcubacteria group bacterium Gr01-1014_8]|nr:MAG: hypothetical protein G01um10148_765 [Parcubacteria group bacterium Gr01-1014_8]